MHRTYGIVGSSTLYVVAPGLEHTLPAGAVPVAAERPTPEAELQPDGSWLEPPVPPVTPPAEPLDLNGITYTQADAIIRAADVATLRMAVLDVLGL